MFWPKRGHPIALGGSGALTELSGDELGHRIFRDVKRAIAFAKAAKIEKMRWTRLGECFDGDEGTEAAVMEMGADPRRSCLAVVWKTP